MKSCNCNGVPKHCDHSLHGRVSSFGMSNGPVVFFCSGCLVVVERVENGKLLAVGGQWVTQENKVRLIFRLWGSNKKPKEIAYRMKKRGVLISVRRIQEYIRRIFK